MVIYGPWFTAPSRRSCGAVPCEDSATPRCVPYHIGTAVSAACSLLPRRCGQSRNISRPLVSNRGRVVGFIIVLVPARDEGREDHEESDGRGAQPPPPATVQVGAALERRISDVRRERVSSSMQRPSGRLHCGGRPLSRRTSTLSSRSRSATAPSARAQAPCSRVGARRVRAGKGEGSSPTTVRKKVIHTCSAESAAVASFARVEVRTARRGINSLPREVAKTTLNVGTSTGRAGSFALPDARAGVPSAAR